jgi:hypothetical protein
MAKKPSLTKELAEAAFYKAWFANIPMRKQDQETYQRTLARYMKRLERLPVLALKTISRVASVEANRSINIYANLRPLPPNVKTPIELTATPSAMAELIAQYKARSR